MRFNYLVLFLTITLAVILGNIISSVILDFYTAERVRQAVVHSSKGLWQQQEQQQKAAIQALEKTREQQARVEAQHLFQQQQARATDANGKRLFRSCEDWKKAHDQLNSYTTQSEVKKHCHRYEMYVNNGVLIP